MTTQIDGAAGSSPANTDNAASETAEADLLSEMGAFLGEADDAKPSASKAKPARKVPAETKPAEADDEEAEATDDAGPKEGKDEKAKPDKKAKPDEAGKADDEGKPVAFKTFKARVDKLTAQRKEAEERADQAAMQVQKLLKAVEILQQENARIAPKGELDPRDERLRAYELEQQVAKFNSDLEKTWADKRAKALEAAQVEERAQAVFNDAKAAAEQHGVELRRVLQVLQVSDDSPLEIARTLAAATPQKPSKPAPKAVTRSGQTAGNQFLGSDDYPTADSMADFLRTLES